MHGCGTRTPKVETVFPGAAVILVDILDGISSGNHASVHRSNFVAQSFFVESALDFAQRFFVESALDEVI
jgi:hypothetical protein